VGKTEDNIMSKSEKILDEFNNEMNKANNLLDNEKLFKGSY